MKWLALALILWAVGYVLWRLESVEHHINAWLTSEPRAHAALWFVLIVAFGWALS